MTRAKCCRRGSGRIEKPSSTWLGGSPLLPRSVPDIASNVLGGYHCAQKDMLPLFGRSRSWAKVRKVLLDLGVLECDERYRIGEMAMRYRLGPSWRTHEVHQVAVTGKQLLARIAHEQAEVQAAPVPPSENLAYWLREVRVDQATSSSDGVAHNRSRTRNSV